MSKTDFPRTISKKTRILITGGSGLFGSNASLLLRNDFEVYSTYWQNPVQFNGVNTLKLNLREFIDVADVLNQVKPQIVIHGAAETNVDSCEKHRESADSLNIDVPRKLARACRDTGTVLVHISTDAFFNEKGRFFIESDQPTPLNYYGETKLLGERAVQEEMPENSLIVRTNFYGWNAQDKLSFGEWIAKAMIEDREIPLFTDVSYSPIYVGVLVDAIIALVQKNQFGTFNIAGSQSLSKYEFAQLLCKTFGFSGNRLKPQSVANAGLVAKRSSGMALSVKKLQDALPKIDLSIETGLKNFREDLVTFGLPKALKGLHWQDSWAKHCLLALDRSQSEKDSPTSSL